MVPPPPALIKISCMKPCDAMRKKKVSFKREHCTKMQVLQVWPSVCQLNWYTAYPNSMGLDLVGICETFGYVKH